MGVGDALSDAKPYLMASSYYAIVGYSAPAGHGVRVATGRHTLILVGDGAFQMMEWELWHDASQAMNVTPGR